MGWTTDSWYVERNGLACPHCMTKDTVVNNGLTSLEGITALFQSECGECGAVWQDVYELTGYTDGVAPDNDDPVSD